MQRGYRIRGFPRLGYGDDQRIGIRYALPVAEFAGDLDRAGNACNRLYPVTRNQAGVVAGSAGEHGDSVDPFHRAFCLDAEQLRHDRLRADNHLERIGYSPRLLEDFLLHVVTVRPELYGVRGQFALVHGPGHFLARAVENSHAIQPDLGHIAFLEIDHHLGDL